MHVHVYDSQRQTALAAASLFAAKILSKPDAVLGLATGSTPVDTYKLLIKWHKDGMLDFSRCRSFPSGQGFRDVRQRRRPEFPRG